MPRSQRCIPAAVLILAIVPTAKADLATYTWGPIAGGGYYHDSRTGQTTYFSTGDGTITIGYDPNNLASSYIDVSTGTPGYVVWAYELFTVSINPGVVEFTAHENQGTSAIIDIYGDPGPLNPYGDPMSLAPLLGDSAGVGVMPGYHSGFYFAGQMVPEPSGLILLATRPPSRRLTSAGEGRGESQREGRPSSRRTAGGSGSPAGRRPCRL